MDEENSSLDRMIRNLNNEPHSFVVAFLGCELGILEGCLECTKVHYIAKYLLLDHWICAKGISESIQSHRALCKVDGRNSQEPM